MQQPKLHVVGSDSKAQSRSYTLRIDNPAEAMKYGAAGMAVAFVALKGAEYGLTYGVAGSRKLGRWTASKWRSWREKPATETTENVSEVKNADGTSVKKETKTTKTAAQG